MKTKGINTSQQINSLQKETNCKKTETELYLKSMMISCFTYGAISKNSYWYEKYISQYEKKLGSRLFEQIYKEQCNFLMKCEIEHCVYTDSEGCTYNNIVYP